MHDIPGRLQDRPTRSAQAPTVAWRPDRCDRIALVLQGGGALGAYQAGVYQAMHEAGVEPDWVSGVSIGAINSAIIAGNPPKYRLRQLRAFWELITERKIWPFTPDGDIFRKARNAHSCLVTTVAGQPGFFAPRYPNPWMSLTGASSATSYYDSAPLRDTLTRTRRFFADQRARQPLFRRRRQCAHRQLRLFRQRQGRDRARAHHGERRAAAGAADGQDRHRPFLGRRHRLQYAAAASARSGRQAQHHGVPGRPVQRQRRFAARHSGRAGAAEGHHVFLAHALHHGRLPAHYDLKMRLAKTLAKVPEEHLSDDDRRLRDELADMPEIAILHIIYQQKAYEGHAKDYEFSGTSMREHWQSGYEDTRRTLKRQEWLTMPAPGTGIVVHDVHRQQD